MSEGKNSDTLMQDCNMYWVSRNGYMASKASTKSKFLTSLKAFLMVQAKTIMYLKKKKSHSREIFKKRNQQSVSSWKGEQIEQSSSYVALQLYKKQG